MKSPFRHLTEDERLKLAQQATFELQDMNPVDRANLLREVRLMKRYTAQTSVMDLTNAQQNRLFEILGYDEE